MRSKLPFRRQETPSSCAVACLRMILEHHGIVVSEAELRKRCQTSELGTRVENLLICARALGFEAEIEYLTVERLRELLGEGVYPIAYINMFPTSQFPYTHTVIVESYEGDRLLIVDPLADPKEIRLSEFLEGWAFYDNMAVIPRRREESP
jgi:ABC-type bacteriocin/lantibiotic exporter with double-glycine peptidase domain